MNRDNLSVYVTTTLMGAGAGLVFGVILSNWYHNRHPQLELLGEDDESPTETRPSEQASEEEQRAARIAEFEEAIHRQEEAYRAKEAEKESQHEEPDQSGDSEREEDGDGAHYDQGIHGDNFGLVEDDMPDIFDRYPQLLEYDITPIQLGMLENGVIEIDNLIDMLETSQHVQYNKAIAGYEDVDGVDIDEDTKYILYIQGEREDPPHEFSAEYMYDPEDDELYRAMRDQTRRVPIARKNLPEAFTDETMDLAFSYLSHKPVGTKVMVHDLKKRALYGIVLMNPWPVPTNVFEKFPGKESQEDVSDS